MFANNQITPLNLGFPDVCLTPMPLPVPIPYPNLSFGMVGFPPVFNILWQCMPAHNLLTMPVFSLGDTPGILLGVCSGFVMGPTRPIIGSFTFLVGGLPCTRLTTINIQNSTNCPGMTIVPGQIKLLVLSP